MPAHGLCFHLFRRHACGGYAASGCVARGSVAAGDQRGVPAGNRCVSIACGLRARLTGGGKTTRRKSQTERKRQQFRGFRALFAGKHAAYAPFHRFLIGVQRHAEGQ
ncbi:hypothetical protein SDC9_71554 [bioreactor metagenome]|uniref:Uncharacterized protein n=1 Tax=bioreactor metagenome TaxID=1076179 RepID=A0A644YG36_9ZZZZ